MTDSLGSTGDDPIRELARQQMDHATSRIRRYAEDRKPALLDEAIDAVEAAVDLVAALDPPELTLYLRSAEQWLLMRWLLTRQFSDLEKVLSRCDRVDRAPANRELEALHQTTIAQAFQERFEVRGDRSDLEEAVLRWRLAVDATPDDHPMMSARRSGLARAEQALMVVADAMSQDALDLEVPTGDGGFLSLRIQAMGFLLRYRASGSRADGARAVELFQRAVAVASDPGERRAAEKSLGDVAIMRFNHEGTVSALDAAITHYRAALDTGNADAERFVEDLARLVNAHTTRALKTGAPAHLEEARQLLERFSEDERLAPVHRAQLWTSMASVLEGRAQYTGSREDIQAAIMAARRATAAAAGTFAEGAALSHLATSLGVEFELTDDPAHLREAAEAATRAAIAAPVGDPVRMVRLFNAGNLWFRLGERERDVRHLDTAVAQLAEPAVNLGEQQARAMTRIQMCQRARYLITGSAGDLDAAVAAGLDRWESPQRLGPEWLHSASMLAEALVERGSRNI